jgi:hypothetical protein
MPDTKPDPETVATAIFVLLHTPPDVICDREMVLPVQTAAEPTIDAGAGLTVTLATASQPVAGITYLIVVIPLDTPVTSPVEAPTVAIDVLTLNQVPPLVTDEKLTLLPAQILNELLVIGEGVGCTVTITV